MEESGPCHVHVSDMLIFLPSSWEAALYLQLGDHVGPERIHCIR